MLIRSFRQYCLRNRRQKLRGFGVLLELRFLKSDNCLIMAVMTGCTSRSDPASLQGLSLSGQQTMFSAAT